MTTEVPGYVALILLALLVALFVRGHDRRNGQ